MVSRVTHHVSDEPVDKPPFEDSVRLGSGFGHAVALASPLP